MESEEITSNSDNADASSDKGLLALRGGSGDSGSKDRVKGPWSPEEDTSLSWLVRKFGAKNWSLIARRIKGRSDRSCRLRWFNQLDPAIKHERFSSM